MGETLLSLEMTDAQFETVSNLVKELCGINLHDGKKELVKARLYKRIRQLGLSSFGDYLGYLRRESEQELPAMMDMLSTNLTYFFREPQHLEFLEQSLLPELLTRHRADRRLRIWSAGCSSGEEPYSLAMVLQRAMRSYPGWDVRILATDLSRRVLKLAHEGVYSAERLRQAPAGMVAEHFDVVHDGQGMRYRLKDSVREMVTFARLNLMEAWPMKGPFDVIFCRNVMIYFDKPTQGRLVERFAGILGDHGSLFIGHSESLAGVRHQFEYVRPTVYRRT